MARIRIIDEWLRSPASPPTSYRSIMVVAERWAEQRVLMRAFAESRDQTRPTIVLHGSEVAIGPAGTDPNGPWGIHVQPPADGLAQELLEQLELAARRLAGSKGNAPRLADEAPPFERKPTNNWAPGTPRDLPDQSGVRAGAWDPQVAASQIRGPLPQASYPQAGPPPPAAPPGAATMFVPGQVATQVPGQVAVSVPQQQVAAPVSAMPPVDYVSSGPIAAPPGFDVGPSSGPSMRRTPVPMPSERRRRRTTGVHPVGNKQTALGYSSGAGAQSAIIRLGLGPAASSRLGRLVDRTVPADFQITAIEREVLNALGERGTLSARAIGELIGVVDGLAWMERLVEKLERHGLDIVAPGEPAGSDPTYQLRR